jgi:uncharacterized membrane protein YagU involved in acid resistance
MGRIAKATLIGGLIAGALDITYALIAFGPASFGAPPMRILQSVAAGAIGRDAATAGGWGTALLGLGLHFVIAIGMAAVFVLAASVFRFLVRPAIVWGFVYGLLLYVAMNYVVVPLSAAGPNAHFASSVAELSARLTASFSEIQGASAQHPWLLWGTIFAHTVLVGVPIALVARRHLDQSA